MRDSLAASLQTSLYFVICKGGSFGNLPSTFTTPRIVAPSLMLISSYAREVRDQPATNSIATPNAPSLIVVVFIVTSKHSNGYAMRRPSNFHLAQRSKNPAATRNISDCTLG